MASLPGSSARRLALAAALLVGAASPATAQQRLAIEALADVEGWATDSGSSLLALNGGDPMLRGRLGLWATLRVARPLALLVYVEGVAAGDGTRELEAQQLEAKLTFSPAFALSGGRLLHPVGGFARRRFSNVNPLIGSPDTYPPTYPWGVSAGGQLGAVDWRLGIYDEPPLSPDYFPVPSDRSLRPAGALGVSLGAAARVAVSATYGNYLGDTVQADMPAGTSRDDFKQTLIGVEARWSAGYVELRGEFLWSRYDVPTVGPVDGRGWYLEGKWTISPRLFAAVRLEHNDYAFVLPINPNFWIGNPRLVRDAEVGLGYRFGSNTLLKASYRRDSWPDPDPPNRSFPDGYAWAVQFSQQVDVTGLFARRY